MILAGGHPRRKMYHGAVSFSAKIADYIRKHKMIAPGDRIGVAVSGGADSVALLRALVELRGELGCVLAVVHFNHKIRVEASDQDASFVEELAQELGLEFSGSSGDAKKLAAQHRLSLETAAREFRYGFFSTLAVDKVATAHTLDDQAETVLMKVVRGAGTRGLSGIWPVVRRQEEQHSALRIQHPEKQVPCFARDDKQNPTQGPSTRAKDGRSLAMTSDIGKRSLGMTSVKIIRPMLGVRRKEVEVYLRVLGQEWREDASNRDMKHTRNKVRHELLPLLEREYNPNIYQQLADAAEVARGEEEFWDEVIRKQEGQQSAISIQHSAEQVPPFARDDNSLELESVLKQPLALRRRVMRAAFERASGKSLDFEHTDALVRFLERRGSSLLQLPEHWFAVLAWPKRLVTFEERVPVRKAGTTKGKSPSKSVSKKSGELAERKV